MQGILNRPAQTNLLHYWSLVVLWNIHLNDEDDQVEQLIGFSTVCPLLKYFGLHLLQCKIMFQIRGLSNRMHILPV